MSRVQLHGPGLFLALVALSACGESALDVELGRGTREQPVVNGSLEYGYPAVGALTLTYAGYGYTGSFCSGTLLDDPGNTRQWVLTAAHCLSDHNGYEVYLEGVNFYVGNDARPSGYSGLPSSGSLYQAGLFFEHPSYDDDPTNFDIALVWLTEPATDVAISEAIPFNTTDIDYLQNSASADYVGFGVSDGASGEGGGVKRFTSIPITWVASNTYTSDQSYTGVCFGDSGGPGLYDFGSGDRIIGINSTVAGNPCVPGDATMSRVDAHEVWINSVLSGTAPDCISDPSICTCAAACQPQGWCDNTACQTATCRDIYSCMIDCGDDQGCAMNCYNNGSPQGAADLDAMYQCFDQYCASATTDAEYQACIEQYCQSQIDTCFPVITGEATCEEAYNCMVECPAGDDGTCQVECYETGTALAQEQIDAMFDCWDTECGTLEGDPWVDCVYDNCDTEMDTCFPPTNCALTGGDCEPGTACYPTASGATDCYTSGDITRGAACDPNITDSLPCADGLICLAETQTTGSCYAFCHVPGDCLTGETCYLFTGSDIGYCDLEPTCTDADSDGYCVEDDCDDTNSAVNPDATESCADTIDNNCDGEINEGCSSCTDGDSDGYCDDVDCNDANPLVWPGAPENCADSIDNDCDTLADGDDVIDCPSGCPDADGDGFPNGQCGGPDCNDSQPTWHPGAEEICTDTYDNNCNGTVNEGCTPPDPGNSYPPLPYSREVDEGCSAVGVPVWPMAFAFLLLRRRRR